MKKRLSSTASPLLSFPIPVIAFLLFCCSPAAGIDLDGALIFETLDVCCGKFADSMMGVAPEEVLETAKKYLNLNNRVELTARPE